MKDTSPIFHFLYYGNFLDNAIKGSLQAIFGFNRTKMPCDDVYCHFSYPSKVLSEFEVDVKIERVLALLVAYAIVTRVVTFFFIKFKLKN
jgi:ATP-binding cassette, subfamily G (WHITE), member 1